MTVLQRSLCLVGDPEGTGFEEVRVGQIRATSMLAAEQEDPRDSQ